MQAAAPDTQPRPMGPLTAGLAHLGAAEPDHAQAVYWFGLAAAEGDAEGLAMYAFCQLEGLGLPRDVEQARIRLEHASARGSLTAKFHLARMLVAGWGGPPDATRGVMLYAAAAAQGHADASFNLAACLDAGWGCQPDRLAAKALFLRARTLGSALKAPGVRVRRHELEAVRALTRRFATRSDLRQLIEERQHEIALMHELLQQHPPRRRDKRLTGRPARALTRMGHVISGVAGALAGALAHWLGWRGKRAPHQDAGTTSIA